MSDTGRPKRPPSLHGRARSRPPQRDSARSAGAVIARSIPIASSRIATVEAELARLKEERGAEADELAKMLVRMAESERARLAAEERMRALARRATELEEICDKARRELVVAREENQRCVESTELATRRAGLAERSAADGAAALERALAELEADRARLIDLEAKLARVRREHADELAALRASHAAAAHQAARALEEERSGAARARQQAAAAEVDLAESRARLARGAGLIEQMERRDEIAGALRARALNEARRVLRGDPGTGDAAAAAGAAAPDAEEPAEAAPDGEEGPLELSD
ncbi:MAG TPA: hypothetical protein VE987_12040 [Polyangiaceae bacterium]|nr:hypothetical protein [Polyangiaceae bacterium]